MEQLSPVELHLGIMFWGILRFRSFGRGHGVAVLGSVVRIPINLMAYQFEKVTERVSPIGIPISRRGVVESLRGSASTSTYVRELRTAPSVLSNRGNSETIFRCGQIRHVDYGISLVCVQFP